MYKNHTVYIKATIAIRIIAKANATWKSTGTIKIKATNTTRANNKFFIYNELCHISLGKESG